MTFYLVHAAYSSIKGIPQQQNFKGLTIGIKKQVNCKQSRICSNGDE